MFYLFIIILISVAISLYVVIPLIRPFFAPYGSESISGYGVSKAPSKYENLLKQRELLFSEIRDIDFDYGLGKLNSSDYNELKNRYRYKAAEVIKEIEELEPGILDSGSESIELEIMNIKKTFQSSSKNTE